MAIYHRYSLLAVSFTLASLAGIQDVRSDNSSFDSVNYFGRLMAKQSEALEQGTGALDTAAEFKARHEILRAQLLQLGRAQVSEAELEQKIPMASAPQKDDLSVYQAEVQKVQNQRQDYLVSKALQKQLENLNTTLKDPSSPRERLVAAITTHELIDHFGNPSNTIPEPLYISAFESQLHSDDVAFRKMAIFYTKWEPYKSLIQSNQKLRWAFETMLEDSDSEIRKFAFDQLSFPELSQIKNPSRQVQRDMTTKLSASDKARKLVNFWNVSVPSMLTDPLAREATSEFNIIQLKDSQSAGAAAANLSALYVSKPEQLQQILESHATTPEAALAALLGTKIPTLPSMEFLMLAAQGAWNRNGSYTASSLGSFNYFSHLRKLAAQPEMTDTLVQVANRLAVTSIYTVREGFGMGWLPTTKKPTYPVILEDGEYSQPKVVVKFLNTLVQKGDQKSKNWRELVQDLAKSKFTDYHDIGKAYAASFRYAEIHARVEKAKTDPTGQALIDIASIAAGSDEQAVAIAALEDIFDTPVKSVPQINLRPWEQESNSKSRLEFRLFQNALNPEYPAEVFKVANIVFQGQKIRPALFERLKTAVNTIDPQFKARGLQFITRIGHRLSDDQQNELANVLVEYIRKAKPSDENRQRAITAVESLELSETNQKDLADITAPFHVKAAKATSKYFNEAIVPKYNYYVAEKVAPAVAKFTKEKVIPKAKEIYSKVMPVVKSAATNAVPRTKEELKSLSDSIARVVQACQRGVKTGAAKVASRIPQETKDRLSEFKDSVKDAWRQSSGNLNDNSPRPLRGSSEEAE